MRALIAFALACVCGIALADGVPLITPGQAIAADNPALQSWRGRPDYVKAHGVTVNRGAFGANVLTVTIDGTEHRFRLYAREPWGPALDERFSWEAIGARDPLWHLRAARRASSECDVFLSTNSYLTAWALRIPASVMVMDLVAWRPDSRPQRRAALIERATLPVAVTRAGAFQCISQATASELIERFPRVASRTHVVPLAADERFSPAAPALPPTS